MSKVTLAYSPGKGRAGQGRAGQGRAGQGRAGQGRAGQGRAGQGRAGQGKAGLKGWFQVGPSHVALHYGDCCRPQRCTHLAN